MLVTKNCGVPVTVTGSLNLTNISMLPPSDLSNAVDLNSISVISAEPRLVANPPIATRSSGVALVDNYVRQRNNNNKIQMLKTIRMTPKIKQLTDRMPSPKYDGVFLTHDSPLTT